MSYCAFCVNKYRNSPSPPQASLARAIWMPAKLPKCALCVSLPVVAHARLLTAARWGPVIYSDANSVDGENVGLEKVVIRAEMRAITHPNEP